MDTDVRYGFFCKKNVERILAKILHFYREFIRGRECFINLRLYQETVVSNLRELFKENYLVIQINGHGPKLQISATAPSSEVVLIDRVVATERGETRKEVMQATVEFLERIKAPLEKIAFVMDSHCDQELNTIGKTVHPIAPSSKRHIQQRLLHIFTCIRVLDVTTLKTILNGTSFVLIGQMFAVKTSEKFDEWVTGCARKKRGSITISTLDFNSISDDISDYISDYITDNEIRLGPHNRTTKCFKLLKFNFKTRSTASTSSRH